MNTLGASPHQYEARLARASQPSLDDPWFAHAERQVLAAYPAAITLYRAVSCVPTAPGIWAAFVGVEMTLGAPVQRVTIDDPFAGTAL